MMLLLRNYHCFVRWHVYICPSRLNPSLKRNSHSRYFIELKHYIYRLFHIRCDEHFPIQFILLKNIIVSCYIGFQKWIHYHLCNYPLYFGTFSMFHAIPFLSLRMDRSQLLSITAFDNPYTTFVLNIFCCTLRISHGTHSNCCYLLSSETAGHLSSTVFSKQRNSYDFKIRIYWIVLDSKSEARLSATGHKFCSTILATASKVWYVILRECFKSGLLI